MPDPDIMDYLIPRTFLLLPSTEFRAEAIINNYLILNSCILPSLPDKTYLKPFIVDFFPLIFSWWLVLEPPFLFFFPFFIPFLCLLLSPTSFLFVLMLRHLSACLLRGGFLHQWHPRHYGLPFWVQNRPSAIFIILLDSSSSSWHWLDLQHSVLLCANRQPGKVLLLHNLWLEYLKREPWKKCTLSVNL